MSARDPNCPLCQEDGGALLWRGPHLRIVEVDDPDYPGFTRVIWNGHLAEMTSLSTHGRDLLMRAVYVVEETQQSVLSPDKINLASLGNMVPHLHWHVIPRWRGDRHFPDPIWAPARVAAALPRPPGRSHERPALALRRGRPEEPRHESARYRRATRL